MIEFNLEEAYKIYQTVGNITEAVKQHCEKIGIEYEEKYRHRLRRKLSNSPETDSDGESYNAIDQNGNLLNPEQICEKFNLPYESLKDASLVSHTSKTTWNLKFSFNPSDPKIDKDFFEEVVKSNLKLVKYKTPKPTKSKTFDRVVITDIHVGMDASGSINTNPTYQHEWNSDVLEKQRLEMCDFIIQNKSSDNLLLDDLGDGADGLNGKTSRGGHDLPQNMSDREIFKQLLEFRIKILDQLVPHYKKITCNLVMESNHGPKIDQMVGEALKIYSEVKYSNVEVVLHDSFMSHYTVGKHTFILTHGKDSEHLKFGMKAVMDNKAKDKVDEYCKQNNLYNGNWIELSKGDSHQAIFDYTTSNDFDYMSYPCFCPPSTWITTNFKNTGYGFVFQVIDENKRHKQQTNYFYG